MRILITQTPCTNFTIGRTYECLYFTGGSVLVVDDNGDHRYLFHNEYVVVKEEEVR